MIPCACFGWGLRLDAEHQKGLQRLAAIDAPVTLNQPDRVPGQILVPFPERLRRFLPPFSRGDSGGFFDRQRTSSSPSLKRRGARSRTTFLETALVDNHATVRKILAFGKYIGSHHNVDLLLWHGVGSLATGANCLRMPPRKRSASLTFSLPAKRPKTLCRSMANMVYCAFFR